MPRRKCDPKILDGTFFEIVHANDTSGNVTAKCLACSNLIKGKFQPTSNFTTHLKGKHAEEYDRYKLYLTTENEVKRQRTLPYQVTDVVNTLQVRAERLIMTYIIKTMNPISTVEDSDFIELVNGLNSNVSVPTAKTFKNKIRQEFLYVKKKIIAKLQFQNWVCVTADIWSGHHRSFMGITCHWILEDFTRTSAVLSLKRFIGSHTGDTIAELLSEVFTSFNIQEKIAFVITDNGSNFVKAFRDYGLDSIDITVTDEGDGDAENIERVDVCDILESATDPQLPKHYRCLSHTLSLVATSDLEKEWKKSTHESATACKKIMRSTFAKCTAVWNKASRSIQFAEKAKEILGTTITTPVVTRWNSTFDSIQQLVKHIDKLDSIMELAKLDKFKSSEVEFLRQYVDALEPVAWALDKFQGDKNMYFGYILPVLHKASAKLQTIVAGDAVYASFIAASLHSGIIKRFDALLKFDVVKCKSELLASMTLPCFKTWWLPESHRETMKDLLLGEMKKIDLSSQDLRKPEEQSFIDDLFDFAKHSAQNLSETSELECVKYIQDPDESISCLHKYERIKKLFYQYNTALPSSAPAERLFSYGKLILRPNRARLSDQMFEELAFLKLNM